MKQINSLDNKLIKHAASLKDKKHREKNGEFLAEGLKNVCDLLTRDFLNVKSVFITEKQRDKFVSALRAVVLPTVGANTEAAGGAVISKLAEDVAGNRETDLTDLFEDFLDNSVYLITENIMKKLCDTDAPQEVVAVAAKKTEFDISAALKSGCAFLYLDRIRDPGNLGTILRTAAAAGYKIVLDNCADVYSPKVVRSTMGAALSADFIKADASLLSAFKQHGYMIVAADMKGENMYEFGFSGRICLAVGSEADGLSPDIIKICDKAVSIPMQGTESLNAGVAAAILMYHFKRPKHEKQN